MPFVIDTDTAGDDVTSLIFGLRWPGLELAAITVCAGNVERDLCVRNALLTVEACGRSDVPVYAGARSPLARDLVTAHYVHGPDGMGTLDPDPPETQVGEIDAVTALLELSETHAGDLQIIAQAPLTNIALAARADRAFPSRIKHLWVMGGANNFIGNITPAAEFNFYVDPEAAHEVMHAGFDMTIVPWDVCVRDGIVTRDELEPVLASDSDIARFYLATQASAWDFVHRKTGIDGISHPDSLLIAMAIDAAVMTATQDMYVDVECTSDLTRGYSLMDANDVVNETIDHGVVVSELMGVTHPDANATVVLRADRERFKEMLFEMVL